MAAAENAVETYLHREVSKRGGTSFKWTSPGRVGVPDRIVVWPMGMIHFVEVKTLDGKLSAAQSRCIQHLRDLGAPTFVVYGKEGVDSYLEGQEC